MAQSMREIKIIVKMEGSAFMFIANCPVWAEFTSEFVTGSSLLTAGLGAHQTFKELLAFSKAIKNEQQ